MNENLDEVIDEFESLNKAEFSTGPIGDLYNAVDEIVGLTNMSVSRSASDGDDSVWSAEELRAFALAIIWLTYILRTSR